MSLFDVIKYPISDVPTKEEFLNLPSEILQQWIKRNDYDILRDFSHDTNMRIFNYFFNADLFPINHYTKSLRKTIAEY